MPKVKKMSKVMEKRAYIGRVSKNLSAKIKKTENKIGHWANIAVPRQRDFSESV
ncbi:MAG: hypothetical protein R3219_03920 [Hydrogenovibrio sp.]|nr:hypothetical protein [Hydrogenovibrio sp.]